MLTVARYALPLFLSLVITSFSVSTAFGVASADCPFVSAGDTVGKFYADSFQEIAATKCDEASTSQERRPQLRNPAADASERAASDMTYGVLSPLYSRVARAGAAEDNVLNVMGKDGRRIRIRRLSSGE